MTLPFSTHLPFPPREETYFIQAIWNGLIHHKLASRREFNYYRTKGEEHYGRKAVQTFIGNRLAFFCWDGFDFGQHLPAKIHTIREDKNDRWRPGMPIHFVIGNRTKKRFQFAPVIPCVSVQKIIIERPDIDTELGRVGHDNVRIWIDGRDQSCWNIYQNDGFTAYSNFARFFPKRFEGKIIHWTNFKY